MNGFYATELGKALAEQRFGVVTYNIDKESCMDNSACAAICLLEQREIRVRLSNSGYEVVDHGSNSETVQPTVFETLDDLLLETSPKYSERRAEELMARLSQLANVPS